MPQVMLERVVGVMTSVCKPGKHQFLFLWPRVGQTWTTGVFFVPLYSIAHMLVGNCAHTVQFGVPTWCTGYALMLCRIVFGGGVIVQLAAHATLHNVTQACQCDFASSSFSLCFDESESHF